MGKLELGWNDESVNVTSDLDSDGTISDNDDIVIESYNNAIKRINDYCGELVTATDNEGVRSVGASKDISGNYSSSKFNLWNKNNVILKDEDKYEEEDIAKMLYWGIINSDEEYWIASRKVNEEEVVIYFHISTNQYIFSSKDVDFRTGDLVLVTHEDGTWGNGISYTRAVRPIVINPEGI